jgi:SPP1 gp7 family putative phage head morphogenesis protein
MSYWQDRMAKSQAKLTNKNVRQVEKQLRKYYGSSMKHVISEFEATYNKLLATVGEGKTPTPADLYKLDKYWQLQGQLRQELQKLGDRQVSALSKIFEIHFFDIYYSIDIEGAKTFTTLDTATVQQMINHIWVADGKSFSQRVWTNTEQLIETLNEQLIHCVATGKKTTELKNLLQERFGVSYSNADMIARTELAHVQTQAAQKRYEDYGIQEVQIWADEDERRCDVCGKLHETRYPTGSAVPIPAHPRCRCCIVPVVEIE